MEVKIQETQIKQINEKAMNDANIYEDKIEELKTQVKTQIFELENQAVLVETEKMMGQKALEELQIKENDAKDKLNAEINELTQEKNKMKDEKHELEETIDKKKDDIVELQKELQKANDEVELRKTIVDQMGENLMKHEQESMMQA